MTNPDTIAVIVRKMRGRAALMRRDPGTLRCDADADAVDEWADRLAALGDVEKDAARYRFWRDAMIEEDGAKRAAISRHNFPRNAIEFDAAISAAMQPQEPNDV